MSIRHRRPFRGAADRPDLHIRSYLLRLPDSLRSDIDTIAVREGNQLVTVMRRLLSEGVERDRLAQQRAERTSSR